MIVVYRLQIIFGIFKYLLSTDSILIIATINPIISPIIAAIIVTIKVFKNPSNK